MRQLTFVILLVSLTGSALNAQFYGMGITWIHSSIPCTLPKADSAFFTDTHRALWKTTRADGEVLIYEGGDNRRSYFTKLTKASREDELSDSVLREVRFTALAGLGTLWNANADTFYVLGFDPLIPHRRMEYNPQWNLVYDTSCLVRVPLYYYPFYLEPANMKKLHQLMMTSLANEFNATLKGDTLVRTIEFVPDSNQYLPQAPYRYLGRFLQVGMHNGMLSTFSSPEIIKPMTKDEIESFTVHWKESDRDGFEPPENFDRTLLPVYYEPASILVYEKWVPDTVKKPYDERQHNLPICYSGFNRKVVAYGVRYTSGKIIWHRAADVDAFVGKTKFNWPPYEQSFRAERFSTMRLYLPQ